MTSLPKWPRLARARRTARPGDPADPTRSPADGGPAEPSEAPADWVVVELHGSYPAYSLPPMQQMLARVESLEALAARLDRLATTPWVAGVLVEVTQLSTGLATSQAIAGMLQRLAEQKRVVAYLTQVDMRSLLVTSTVPEVVAPESADVMVTGFATEQVYLGGFLRRLGVGMENLRVREYKSALTPLSDDHMDEHNREQLTAYLDSVERSWVNALASARGVDPAQAEQWVGARFTSAAQLLEAGLITRIAYDDEIATPAEPQWGKTLSLLVPRRPDGKRAGIRPDASPSTRPDTAPSTRPDTAPSTRPDTAPSTPAGPARALPTPPDLSGLPGVSRLSGLGGLAGLAGPLSRRKPDGVAVVPVIGAIVPGRSRPAPPIPTGRIPFAGAQAGAQTVVAALRRAERDPHTKAILLYVDSGGGSALASDLIGRAVATASKPVVAVMGEVAASGGYYVLTHATHVVASPFTVTGSIGVVVGKPVLAELAARQQINPETVGREEALLFSPFRPFSPDQRAWAEQMMHETYDRFVDRVATGRRLTRERVDEIGRGRIWSGADALPLGLVDQLGDLQAGLATARRLAGLPEHAPARILSAGFQLPGAPTLARPAAGLLAGALHAGPPTAASPGASWAASPWTSWAAALADLWPFGDEHVLTWLDWSVRLRG